MHGYHVNRDLLLVNLAVLVVLCIFLLTKTPTVLVIFAVVITIIGIFGWLQSWDFSHPWIARLVSTLLIGLSVWFLIWYFRTGRTILHPNLILRVILNTCRNPWSRLTRKRTSWNEVYVPQFLML